jgi:mRNA interferase RelE/StbE
VQLIFAARAIKAMMAMPKKDAAALTRWLEAIATDPFSHQASVTRMQGDEHFRVRHGNWRAMYHVDRATQQVVVDTVGHRREVYR